MNHYFNLLTVVVTSIVCSSCACRIDPPPTRLYSNTDLSGKVAADLQQANAKGELSGNWKSTVDRQFSTLNDDNATYYMLLEAIHCESRRNKPLAAQMMQTLDREMVARRGPQRSARASWVAKLPPELANKRAEVEANIR